MTLFKDHISDHLTPAPADHAARRTFPGMVHFAGSGPAGSTCRECLFWAHIKDDYRSKNGSYRGVIKPAICKKFKQMMQTEGNQIPDDAAACKYFEENPTPPARFAK